MYFSSGDDKKLFSFTRIHGQTMSIAQKYPDELEC